MRVCIKKSLKIMEENKEQVVFVGNSRQKIVLEKTNASMTLFKFLLVPRTESEISDFIDKNAIDKALFLKFKSYNILTSHIIDDNSIFSRHEGFFSLFDQEELQSKIGSKTVVLIGCGGIGNNITQLLSRMGVGKLILVDDDVVEMSNLTRQVIFDFNDIGKSKVNVIKEKLKNFSETIIDCIQEGIETQGRLEELFKGHKIDFVILSADSSEKLQLYSYNVFAKNGIPLTTCGYANNIMISGPILDGPSSEFAEIFMNSAEGDNQFEKIYKEYSIVPSFGPINSFISSYTVIEMIKYWMASITPETYFKRVQIDFIDFSKRFYNVKKDLS